MAKKKNQPTEQELAEARERIRLKFEKQQEKLRETAPAIAEKFDGIKQVLDPPLGERAPIEGYPPLERHCHQCKAALAETWPSDYCNDCRPVRDLTFAPPKFGAIIPKETTIIHTYFVEALSEYGTELALLVKWIQWWESKGYVARVLNESHARANPRFEEFSKRIDGWYSQNPRLYERACWLRWLALEQVGGGAISDHDVFCRELRPIPVTDDFTIFESGIPSLASGTKVGVGKFLDYLMSLPDGVAPEGSHFSDMIAVRSMPGVKQENWCVQYTDTDWLKAHFVHMSHSATNKDARPRHQHVDRIMAMKGAA